MKYNCIQVAEIVRGLGAGGAELSLLARLKRAPEDIDTVIINLKSSLDSPDLRDEISSLVSHVSFTGLFRYMRAAVFLRLSTVNVLVVRTPLDTLVFASLRFLRILPPSLFLLLEVHSSRISANRIWSKLVQVPLFICARSIDMAVCVSEDAERGEQAVGARHRKIMPFGTPTSIPSSTVRHVPSARLIFVGRMVESKQPVWLLERIRNISRDMELPSSFFTFLGDGPLLEVLKEKVVQFGLQDKVNVIGFTREVGNFLVQNNTLVICSKFEGLPLVLMEAKLAGLRVLSTPIFGDSSLFDDKDYLARSFDEQEFELLLSRAILDDQPSLQERLERRSRFIHFSPESFSRRYYSLLRQSLLPFRA